MGVHELVLAAASSGDNGFPIWFVFFILAGGFGLLFSSSGRRRRRR